MIIKLQNGDKFKLESEARRKYKEYSQLSIGQKLKRNLNIASNFLKSGPSITNFGNAVSALFGGFSPENPDLHYGEAPGVGIKNFGNLVRTARVVREFNNVINKGLKLVPSKVKDFKSYEDYQRNGLTARQMLERDWLDRQLKDPNSMVHYDNGNHKSSFRKNDGAYIKNGKLYPGQSSKGQTPYIWWGQGGPWQDAHKMFINPSLPIPKRYISIPKDNKFIHVKSAVKEIGQNKVANETVLPDEYVTEGPVDLSNATILERSPFGWWERIKVQPTPEIIKSKPYIRWSQKGYLNEAYNIEGGPGQKFLVVKDVDNPQPGVLNTKGNGEYSLHFHSTRDNPNKEEMFQALAEFIPEGGKVSTWGTISKGGYHGINRFGEQFGWPKVGERPAVNRPVNIFQKPRKEEKK